MAVNICTAVKQGDAEMLRKLLEAGADPKTYCTKEGFVDEERKPRSYGSKSLLYLAVENENLPVLKMLLKNLTSLSLSTFLHGKMARKDGPPYDPMNIAVLRSNEKIAHEIIEKLSLDQAFYALEENIRLTIKSKQYKMFDYLIGELTKKVDNQYDNPYRMPFDEDYKRKLCVDHSSSRKYTILSELGPEEKYFWDRLLEIGVEPIKNDIQKEATEGNLELVEKLKSKKEECKLLREERSKKIKKEEERQTKKRNRERKKQELKDDYGGCAIVIGILIVLALFL
jgi:hypothetical protein